MKKIFIFIFIILSIDAYTQKASDDLPAEFQDVAKQAFQKVSPATRQWFMETAKQHPPGNFDTAWARKKLKERFTSGNVEEYGELFAVMMAYMKMMNKEAREDRKLAAKDKELELTAKDEKIKKDNSSMDAGMQESREKADQAMSAAQTEMWLGIVSGISVSAASVNNAAGGAGNMVNRNKQLVKTPVVRPIDSNKVKAMNTDKTKMTEPENEKDNAAKVSADRQKAIKNAVKKLLDQMGDMTRNIKL